MSRPCFEAGGAALAPGADVVGGGPGGQRAAFGPAAALVAGFERAAQAERFGAGGAADVEGQAVGPADGADLGAAAQARDLAGSEQGAVPAAARRRPADQPRRPGDQARCSGDPARRPGDQARSPGDQARWSVAQGRWSVAQA